MPKQLYTNNASSQLVAPVSNVGLSIQITASEGAKFPNPTGGDWFVVTLVKVLSGIEIAHEIVKVTANVSDVFTIIRAQEGTTALAWAVDDWVQLRATAAKATAFEDHMQNVSNPHTVTKTQVGLGNVDNTSNATERAATATLTNKTLTSPVINTPTGIVKGDVGLGNVDNTADTAKPVSTAQQIALDLKAGLGGNTFTGAQVLSDQLVSRGLFKDCGLVYLDKGNSGTTTQTLDFTAGSHQKITATGNHTIATSNWPPTGNLGEMLLELVNGAAYTITWPTINWVKSDGSFTTTFSANGVTLQTSGTDFIVLWTRNAGTTIYGKIVR